MLRSMTVTLFMLTCAVFAVALMGKAYSVIQKDAFGVEKTAYSIDSKDYITVFGREIYFPLISVVESAKGYFEKYCSGMIKLLGYAIDITKELGNILFK